MHAGSIVQAFNLFGRTKYEVTGAGNSTQAGKFSNSCAHRQVRNQLLGRSNDFIHAGSGNSLIFFGILLISVRTDEGVAVGSSANQNTFGFFGRGGEYHAVNQTAAGSLIKQNIFALTRSDGKGIITGQLSDFVSINTGSINHIFSSNSAFIGFDTGNFAVFLNEAQYLAVANNFCTVLYSALSKSNSSTERPAYAGTRSPQSTLDSGQVRLLLKNFFFRQDLQAFNAVLFTALQQLLQSLHFLIGGCSNQGTGPFNIQVQFVLQLVVQSVATNVGNSFEAAGRSVKASMKNCTVSFSSADSDVRLFFQQNAFQVILGKLAQYSSTYNAATNNDYISRFYKFHSVTSLLNFLIKIHLNFITNLQKIEEGSENKKSIVGHDMPRSYFLH